MYIIIKRIMQFNKLSKLEKILTCMDVFHYKKYSKYKCNHNINSFLIYQNQFSELNIISIRH